MISNKFLVRLSRRAIWPVLAGATVLQLGGCDPAVRQSLLNGLQTTILSLVTALINTFFLTLQNLQPPTTQPTVRATFEWLARGLA